MNNEIGRKITSLTLMTIMVAGGMTFAVPGVMPAAHAANANLFVSAENSQFNNYFGGPMVIEVVVNDPDVKDTDEAKGEPDVTINGDILRMVQATDGLWYAYFADEEQADLADATADVAGFGLDFGTKCDRTNTDLSFAGTDDLFSDTQGFYTTQVACTDGAGGDITNVVREEKTPNDLGPGQIGIDIAAWPVIQLYDLNPTGNVVIQYNKGGNPQTVTLTFDTLDGTLDASLDRQSYPTGAAVHATLTDQAMNIDPTDEDSWTFDTLNGATYYQAFNESGDNAGACDDANVTGDGALTLDYTDDGVDTIISIDAIAAGGATYVVGNIVNIVGGNGDAFAVVTAVDGAGAVTAVELINGGTGYALGVVAGAATAEIDPDGAGDLACAAGGFGGGSYSNTNDISGSLDAFLFEDGGLLFVDADQQGTGTNVITFVGNSDVQFDAFDADGDGVADGAVTQPVTLVELGPNSGVFANYDELDAANMVIGNDALRGTSATIDWDDTGYTVVVGFDFANIDIVPVDDTWNSGEAIEVILMDQDANKNSRFDEDLDLNNPEVDLIPSIQIGTPITLGKATDDAVTVDIGADGAATADIEASNTVQAFSDRMLLTASNALALEDDANDIIIIPTTHTTDDLTDLGFDNGDFSGFMVLNYDFRSLIEASGATTFAIGISDDGGLTNTPIAIDLTDEQGEVLFNNANLGANDAPTFAALAADTDLAFTITITDDATIGLNTIGAGTVMPIVLDLFSFGFTDDGADPSERVDNMIVRLELEENGDNTGEFIGEIEYIMLNQLNILDASTYDGIGTIADDPILIVSQDFTDEDSLRVNYNDLGADGVTTPVGDQEEAPTHSGTVSFDNDSYKIADTVTITLEDQDLNVDSDLREIYTTVALDAESAALLFTDDAADGLNAITELSILRSGAGLAAGPTTVSIGTEGAEFTVTPGADGTLDAGDITAVTTAAAVPDGSTVTVASDTASINDSAAENIGAAGLGANQLGVLMNITFDDELWAAQGADLDPTGTNDSCDEYFATFNDGLASTGITMVETTIDSGIFEGDFQIPDFYCSRSNGGEQATTSGTDIEVNYIDYRDASGEIIEVGDGAGVRANTGSISLDRTVYPVPFGVPGDFADSNSSSPDGRSMFPIHVTGIEDEIEADGDEFLPNGDLTIHLRVNDPDFDISASGSDSINRDVADTPGVGPVKISVIRGSESVTIGYAGGPEEDDGFIDVDDSDPANTRQFGPIAETAPDSGIFEADIILRYTDGPADDRCPTTANYSDLVDDTDAGVHATNTAAEGQQVDRFAIPDSDDYCILQGDILQVEYTDPEDASGDENTVTDSATFDLRNGVLQTDKSVYIIGGDMIMTLIEPDLDLENDEAETYDLDLIEWDSDAATLTMGNSGGEAAAFDPEPTDFRETGDSTGIFQIVIEIPEELDGDRLERGEEIVLEYTDWGPSGSDYVGEEDEDVNVTVYTSNFGATVELDQKVYTWTDKVFITIVAPDHNFDGDLVDEIGNTDTDPIKISTRGFDLDNYKLVETGTDTGIFTGEVILVGFKHDADGDSTTGDADGFDAGNSDTRGNGPTDGFLETDDDDGITVSFEFSEDETVVGSALIRWNIGEVQWLEASYPASGTGVVRIIDPDMNLDPEAVDNFDVDIWSDSDAGGIDLTVTETNEATGIFEGTVFFTTFDESSGHRLRVAEGDTVTAEYEDNTLPDPYTTADELDITATSLIGTVVPPLERAPAANLRTVDAFGNSLDTVSVGQQVQISADLANGQDREQSFAYLVQIQDGNGVTVSLAWITGSLASGQSFSPALSWIPSEAGTYTATAFVWESVDNPTALSPPVSTTVTVN